jgi:hypothetical protein
MVNADQGLQPFRVAPQQAVAMTDPAGYDE